MKDFLDTLLSREKYLLVTHEKPDGDAWGSLLGLHLYLKNAGKDVVSVIEQRDLDSLTYIDELLGASHLSVTSLPDDAQERAMVCTDLARFTRAGYDFGSDVPEVFAQIDHHPDNPGFALNNLILPDYPSTTQILYYLFKEGPEEYLSTDVAKALAVGLLTDTLFFSVPKTNGQSFKMAGELLERGVEVPKLSTFLQKELTQEEFSAQQVILADTVFSHDGQVASVVVKQSDLEPHGLVRMHTHNILKSLRNIAGVRVFLVMVEDRDAPGNYKGSLRSDDPEITISDIARLYSGGGHDQAAGFYVRGEDPQRAAEKIRSLITPKLS